MKKETVVDALKLHIDLLLLWFDFDSYTRHKVLCIKSASGNIVKPSGGKCRKLVKWTNS